MKKLLLLALLAAASTTGALAQARAGGELSSKDYTGGGTTGSRNTGFGIKGGYNYTNVYGNGTNNFDLKGYSGYHAGVYGQFGLNEFASVQVELLYSRKGFESSRTGSLTVNTERRLDYLQLPILFVGNFTETLSFHIGPQISLLTKVLENGTNVAIADKGYNSLDYGAVAGLEARVGPARVGARYDLGLGRVYNADKVSLQTGTQVKDRLSNGTLELYVGIGFTQ